MYHNSSGTYVILYENTYHEKRVLLVQCRSKEECKDILKARGLKALAYCDYDELVVLLQEKKKK